MLISLVLVCAVVQSGCGSDARSSDRPGAAARDAVVKHVSDGDLRPGDTIPKPMGKTVLRMANVHAANGRRRVAQFDMKTLERMPLTEVTIDEPFVKRRIRFTGVAMDDLLAHAEAPPSVGKVRLRALDDYEVLLTRQDLFRSKALLATRADGKPIPIKDGGPIRIVFAGDTDTARNPEQWIWSVDRIDVRR